MASIIFSEFSVFVDFLLLIEPASKMHAIVIGHALAHLGIVVEMVAQVKQLLGLPRQNQSPAGSLATSALPINETWVYQCQHAPYRGYGERPARYVRKIHPVVIVIYSSFRFPLNAPGASPIVFQPDSSCVSPHFISSPGLTTRPNDAFYSLCYRPGCSILQAQPCRT